MRIGVLSTVLLLVVAVAEAALPPYVYEQAREQATYHVQIKVAHVTPPAKTPGECDTLGDVVRIFRDTSGTLRLGTRLAFAVSCSRRGDPPLVGGTLWTDHDALMVAKYLEVFLNRVDGRYQVALWQSRIIDAPTNQPVIGPAAPAAAAEPARPVRGGDPYDEGMRLYNAQQDRASIPYFDRAIAANPARPEAFVGRGMAYYALGEHPRAIDDFTAAARVNPRSGWGHFERAATYWAVYPNRPATTLADLDEAVRREPDNASYYNLRGVVLTATDNFQRAIADFDRTIALRPTMAHAYGNRGLAKYFLNRKRDAAEDIRQCLVLDPSLQPWLEQQVAMIPAVQRWQADFLRWYREIQRDAASARDDLCGVKYAGHAGRIQNCRSNGMNDTEERIRRGTPGL